MIKINKTKKYELVKEMYTYSGFGDDAKKVYRIRALHDFGSKPNVIHKGDLGGYIESEENLSQTGDCWVWGDSIVCGCSRIEGDSKVLGDSFIFNTIILKNSYVKCSRIYDSYIYGWARVINSKVIKSTIRDSVQIDNAKLICCEILDDVKISQSKIINNFTEYEKSLIIRGTTEILDNSQVILRNGSEWLNMYHGEFRNAFIEGKRSYYIADFNGHERDNFIFFVWNAKDPYIRVSYDKKFIDLTRFAKWIKEVYNDTELSEFAKLESEMAKKWIQIPERKE